MLYGPSVEYIGCTGCGGTSYAGAAGAATGAVAGAAAGVAVGAAAGMALMDCGALGSDLAI
jgi:hypothetical protein